MRHHRLRTLGSTLALAALLLAVGAACQPRGLPPEPEPQAERPAAEPTSTESSPTTDAAAAPDPLEGTIGQPVSAGIWTITVREAGPTGEVEGVTPSRGQLLRVEVDVRNGGGQPLELKSSDWRLLVAGTTYNAAPASKPEERGERTVGPGETEDVKVVFDIPEVAADPVLVFTPASATAGARVRLR